MPPPGQTALVNGGNAGFGGRGVDLQAVTANPQRASVGGAVYGDLDAALQGGSGGASLQNGLEFSGGGGGGALELVATQTLTVSASITARGGEAETSLPFGNGGAGSGGGIRLSGQTVLLDAPVLAGGGQPEGSCQRGSIRQTRYTAAAAGYTWTACWISSRSSPPSWGPSWGKRPRTSKPRTKTSSLRCRRAPPSVHGRKFRCRHLGSEDRGGAGRLDTARLASGWISAVT